jgi:hypothetical protein
MGTRLLFAFFSVGQYFVFVRALSSASAGASFRRFRAATGLLSPVCGRSESAGTFSRKFKAAANDVMVILGGADLSAQLSGLGKADRGG